MFLGGERELPNAGSWDSLSLRVVRPTVNGEADVEGVLDSGCQMTIIRKDLWLKLGGTLRPDEGCIMETANRSKVQTVGKAMNVRFSFDDEVEVMLNAQIVEVAPFEVLLGRPFFAATQCETKDFPDGNQTIVLTDPKSGRRVMVPTYERVAQGPGRKERNVRDDASNEDF